MNQLTDFGKKVMITLVIVAAAAILFAGYKLIYLPLAAVESRYWGILITVLAICLAALMVGTTGWIILRLASNLKRNLAPHGEPVYQKTKDGKEFVGWRQPDGTFLPKQQPAMFSQVHTLNLGHQAYPPKYLLDAALPAEDEEAAEQALLPDATSTWEQEKGGMGPERFFLGWLAGGKKLWATFDQLLVSIAAGMQGFGKTTIARLVMLQHAMWGGGVVIYDAYNDMVRELSGWFEEAYSDEAEVELSAQCVLEEVSARMRAWRTGSHRFKPLLIVVDEVTQYEATCPSLVALIKQGSDVCRKVKVRLFLSATRFPASSVGGRMARGNTGNVFIFKTMTKDLLNDFGIIGKLAETLHGMLFKQKPGYCIVRSGPLALEGELLLLPDISPDLFKNELTWARRRQSSIWMEPAGEDTLEEEQDFSLWRLATRRRAAAEETAPEIPARQVLAPDRWEDGTSRLAPLPQKTDRESAQRAWNRLFQPAASATATAATTGAEQPQAPITPIWTRSNSSSSKRLKVTQEQRKAICRMFREETQSITLIARTVLGARGGEPFYLVKEVLAEEGLLVNEPTEAAEEE